MQRIKVNNVNDISENDQFVIDMERVFHDVMVLDDTGNQIFLSQLETADKDVH